MSEFRNITKIRFTLLDGKVIVVDVPKVRIPTVQGSLAHKNKKKYTRKTKHKND